MANEQNLKPIRKGELSKEEAKRRGRKGGIKQGENKRANKTFKEIAIALLSSELTDKEKTMLQRMFPNIDVDMLTRKAAILSMQVNNAMKGDLKSAQWLQEVAGEKDAQKVEVNSTSRVVDMSKLSTEQLEAIASIPIPEDEKE